MSARPRGFTLLELGIVIAVASVLCAMVAPTILEEIRSISAERVADSVWRIQEAGQWAFVDSATNMQDARWPGQQDCDGEDVTSQLADKYIARQFLINPWGRPYVIKLVTGDGTERRCLMRIETSVPQDVRYVVYERLRAPKCSHAINGFVKCMSDVPPPGRAVELSSLRQWSTAQGRPNGTPW
jgi:prepilin-type N-terminal cleavage/methylation domain-containing protein